MKVDMSAKAVTTRLQRTSQLRRLCLSLAQAKPVAPAPDAVSTMVKGQSNQRDKVMNRGENS